METAAFTTAKVFNAASKESDWGYEIVQEGDLWKLIKIDGTFICSAPQESLIVLFGKLHSEIDKITAG